MFKHVLHHHKVFFDRIEYLHKIFVPLMQIRYLSIVIKLPY